MWSISQLPCFGKSELSCFGLSIAVCLECLTGWSYRHGPEIPVCKMVEMVFFYASKWSYYSTHKVISLIHSFIYKITGKGPWLLTINFDQFWMVWGLQRVLRRNASGDKQAAPESSRMPERDGTFHCCFASKFFKMALEIAARPMTDDRDRDATINITCSAQARLHWTRHGERSTMKFWRFWRV